MPDSDNLPPLPVAMWARDHHGETHVFTVEDLQAYGAECRRQALEEVAPAAIKYTISCIGTGRGWRYRVTLWCGRVAYQGQRDYERHQDAERAAKAAGAKVKPE